MMPAWLFFIFAIMLLWLEGVLGAVFGGQWCSYEVPLVLTVYLGLRGKYTTNSWLLLALLVPVEWQVMGIFGLYSFGLVWIFFMLRLLGGKLERRWGIGQILLTAGSVLTHHVITMICIFLVQPDSPILHAVFVSSFDHMFMVCVATFLIGTFFDRIANRFNSQMSELEYV